jgi:tetratricopeptide (TPR) repeat protein
MNKAWVAAKRIARGLAVILGLFLLAVGALALANAHLSDHTAVVLARDWTLRGLMALSTSGISLFPGDLPGRMDPFLTQGWVVYAFLPAGLIVVVAALLPGGRTLPEEAESVIAVAEGGGTLYSDPKNDAKDHKRVLKQAASLAKAGENLEAAEHCVAGGLYDEAAGYFIAAEEFGRAAEIRHDQNRFVESAELYRKAGKNESAGVIFGQQGEYRRAGEAYEEAGNLSVAGEMYEKARDFRSAADAYAKAGFPRNAATAYATCEQWEKAAICLEETIREEARGVGGNTELAEELRKLVMMAGSLYERAEKYDRAQAILQQGELFESAAEVALRAGNDEEAADLFLKARNVPRAAGVLRRIGRNDDAARALAEYHRDRNEDELAAGFYEEADDLLAAADLYRMLEQFSRAGKVYERFGDFAQAAEMFAAAQDRSRAADNYERAEMFADAAECYALAGNSRREAELLVQAGESLRAGEICLEDERTDDAIKALQGIPQEHADFVAASALLGGIFSERGLLPLAIKTLKAATDGQEVDRANVEAFYCLATCYESDGQPATAIELYQKVLVFDFSYADAADRVAQLEAAVAADSDSAPLTATSREGRYKITGTLGRGGMGIVYKADDTVLDRTVAFKVLPDTLKENPQALKNFLREAKSAAALNHPNIVTVFDAGEQDGAYYIAMEYVDGNTLKEIVKHRGKISTAGIVHVLAQMSEALAYAHDQKIVHRDIKTANAMWTRERKVKIMDFGLAKAIEEVRNHTTVVSGTPYYMSPEQTLGRNVDHRTDSYSLGVSVFEMATGRLPFTEGNLPYHHVHTPPPDPREFVPELAPVLAQIVLRCMQKDPADRFQSADEILAVIKAALAK